MHNTQFNEHLIDFLRVSARYFEINSVEHYFSTGHFPTEDQPLKDSEIEVLPEKWIEHRFSTEKLSQA